MTPEIFHLALAKYTRLLLLVTIHIRKFFGTTAAVLGEPFPCECVVVRTITIVYFRKAERGSGIESSSGFRSPGFTGQKQSNFEAGHRWYMSTSQQSI